MKPIKITSRKPKNILHINWLPSNLCNFHCSYCYPGCNDGTHRAPRDINLLIKNTKYLFDRYTEFGKTKFQVFLAGGEPTLWPQLEDFIKQIKEDHNVYFTLVSNGSRTLRWFEENGQFIDNAHLTHHLEEGNIEHITQVADILYEKGCKTTVKVLMKPSMWDEGIAAINYMKKNSKHSWFIVSGQVNEPDNSWKYTKEQEKYLKKELKRIPNLLWFWKNRHLLKEEIRLFESDAVLDNGKTKKALPSTYINHRWNNFQGWECNIGYDNLHIDWTGKVLAGSCGIKLLENKELNILSEDFIESFNLDLKPVVCPFTSCKCKPETHVDKQIIRTSLEEYQQHKYTNLESIPLVQKD
jgi:MoaA/NifB/PqqE/SkfB family radical SAM enzyme